MLDIFFILASTSPTSHLSISPSMSQVQSIATSNVDGVTPHRLLQQMYGTQVLDEDVDLELSDEELESVVAGSGDQNHSGSDIIVYNDTIGSTGRVKSEKYQNGRTIVTFESMRPFVDPDLKDARYNRQDLLINHIAEGFKNAGIYDKIDPRLPGFLSNQVRDNAPIIIKNEFGALMFNLKDARFCYAYQSDCPDSIK